jgi:tetrapyrrole methylase family protein/MazG family protein
MTQNNRELQVLIATIETLRGENGCPWDKKQTSSSLLEHLRSECEELVDAVQKNDAPNICEELGDLLYLLLMLAEINKDLGKFQISDVIRGINEKLIRRHPHVFAGLSYESEEQLAVQWQQIKAEEKKKNTV